jgi:hypothetical protein
MFYDLGFIGISEKRKTHLVCSGSTDFACRAHYTHTELLVRSGALEINDRSAEVLVRNINGTGTLNGMQAMSEHLIETILSCRKCVRIVRGFLNAPPSLPLFERNSFENSSKPTL